MVYARNPASVTWTSRRTAAFDGRLALSEFRDGSIDHAQRAAALRVARSAKPTNPRVG